MCTCAVCTNKLVYRQKANDDASEAKTTEEAQVDNSCADVTLSCSTEKVEKLWPMKTEVEERPPQLLRLQTFLFYSRSAASLRMVWVGIVLVQQMTVSLVNISFMIDMPWHFSLPKDIFE